MKNQTFGPVQFGEWYESNFTDKYRFARVTQEVTTVYTGGGDDTYEGTVSEPYQTTRSAFTKWDINSKKKAFLKDILHGDEGRGRIISVIGCDLFSVLTEDQKAQHTKLIGEGNTDEAEELVASWAESMLKSNEDGEILEYNGLEMFGQYFYRKNSEAVDIDHRAADFTRLMAERNAPTPEVAKVEKPIAVPAGLVAEDA